MRRTHDLSADLPRGHRPVLRAIKHRAQVATVALAQVVGKIGGGGIGETSGRASVNVAEVVGL